MNPKAAIYLHLMNQRYGAHLECLPRASWPEHRAHDRARLREPWRSRDYLVSKGAER